MSYEPRNSNYHDHLCTCPGCNPGGPELTEEGGKRLNAEMGPEPTFPCDLCGKPTTNAPESRVGVDYNPTTEQERFIPYTMPVYCDDCLKVLEAEDSDQKEIEVVRQKYRNGEFGGRG